MGMSSDANIGFQMSLLQFVHLNSRQQADDSFLLCRLLPLSCPSHRVSQGPKNILFLDKIGLMDLKEQPGSYIIVCDQ